MTPTATHHRSNPPSLLSPGRSPAWLVVATAVVVIAGALALRLPRLNAFITPDEMKWVCRSVNFHRGLRTGDLATTYQMGHPGVLTMWVGAPAMGIDPLEPWLDICVDSQTRDILHEEPKPVIRELGNLVFSGRRGVAVLTSLALGAAFLLLYRLFRSYYLATLTMALVLLDPFTLGLSRLLHVDAIEASFVFLSLLCLALYLREPKPVWPIASGLFGGLALLEKSPAVGLFALAGLVILYRNLGRPRPLGGIVRDGLLWFAPAALVYVALWPAMWVQPVQTLTAVYETAFGYASEPHSGSNFFWGAPRPDPGWAFYPVAVAFRLTPWTMIGLALGLVALARWPRRERDAAHPAPAPYWLLLAFVGVYGLIMTIGQKKFDRYLLPGFAPLTTVASMGWLRAIDWVRARSRGWVRIGGPAAFGALLAALAVIGLGTIAPHAPYYLTYYNPLLGGIDAAVNKLLVGWGEGLDVAAAYLNTLPGAEEKEVAARALPEFAPFFAGTAYKESLYSAAHTDYVLLYRNEVQRLRCEELLARYYGVQEPLHVVQLQDSDYVWIYENRSDEAPMAYIAERADAATDAILVSEPSLLAERYDGPLPVYTVDPAWDEAELARYVEQVASSHGRVWYVRYRLPDDDPAVHRTWLDLAWQAHAFRVEGEVFTDIEVSLWETEGHLPFVEYPQVELPAGLTFGDASGDILRLDAITIHGPAAQWGRSTRVSLDWTVLRQPEAYYSAYLHLLDGDGRRWGIADSELQDAFFAPTVYWREGDTLRTDLLVEVSPGAAPDDYRLVLGVYDRLAREPLAATSWAHGDLGGDRVDAIEIGTLAVQPSPHPVDPLADIAVSDALNAQPVPSLRLVGWHRDWQRLRFGQTFAVALVWQAIEPPPQDYRLELALTDASGKRWAEGVFEPASDVHPTSRWAAGEVVQRSHTLRVAEDAPAGEMILTARLLSSANGGADGAQAGDVVTLATLPVDGHRFEAPPMEHSQPATLGEAITLLGYDLSASELQPGQTLELTLYWQARSAPPADYKVFAHLYGPDGSVPAQDDSAPIGGHYPTSHWQPGEVVVDRHPIALGDLPPGTYRLGVGMYDPQNPSTRLPLAVDGARQPDDRLLLDATVTVQAPR